MTQGGARKGAGRPALPDSERRERLTVRIKPAVRLRLEQLAAADPDELVSLGEVIERLVEDTQPGSGT